MSYRIAHVDSLVEVDGKIGKVITGSPHHLVGGSGGGAGGADTAVTLEAISQETEDMTGAERRSYLNDRFGPDVADALDRATQVDVEDPGADAATGPNTPSRLVGCGDITNATPNSFKLSRHYTVASLSSATYMFQYNIPNTTAKGLSRADTICNLKHLAINTLDPLKDWVPAHLPGVTFRISNAFRNKAGRSDHNSGSAADLHFFRGSSRVPRSELRSIFIKLINEARIPFTQILLEFQNGSAPGWIHIANRKSNTPSAMRIGYSMNDGRSFNGGIPRSV